MPYWLLLVRVRRQQQRGVSGLPWRLLVCSRHNNTCFLHIGHLLLARCWSPDCLPVRLLLPNEQHHPDAMSRWLLLPGGQHVQNILSRWLLLQQWRLIAQRVLGWLLRG